MFLCTYLLIIEKYCSVSVPELSLFDSCAKLSIYFPSYEEIHLMLRILFVIPYLEVEQSVKQVFQEVASLKEEEISYDIRLAEIGGHLDIENVPLILSSHVDLPPLPSKPVFRKLNFRYLHLT